MTVTLAVHHEACGGLTRLVVGQRYLICPCWRPLSPPGRVFIPESSWNERGFGETNLPGHFSWSPAEMNRLRLNMGGRIITAAEVSLSGQSVWADNDAHRRTRRGLCVNRQFLQRTELMDLFYLIASPGHPETLGSNGESVCDEGYRTIWMRAHSMEEAELRLKTVFASDLNAQGARESIVMCLQ